MKNLSKFVLFTALLSFLMLFPSFVLVRASGCPPGETQTTSGTCAPDGSVSPYYPTPDSSSGTSTTNSTGGVTFTNAPAVACTSTGIAKLICTTQQLINSIVPLLLALGVVYFVWGVVQYMIADGEEAKKKGKDVIIYGIIGFAVIIGLWGLVNIVVNTFGLSGALAPSFTVNGGSGACNAPVSGAANSTLQAYLGYITCIINNSVIPLIFAVAVVFFVWGTVKFFIINADEEKKRAEGKQFMIWGIVAIAVMLSIWALVGILQTTFNIKTGDTILPQVTGPGQ
jgi:hypothetical protein